MRHHSERRRARSIGLTVAAAVLGGLSWSGAAAATAQAAPATKCNASAGPSSYSVSCPRGTSGLYRAFVTCGLAGPGGTTLLPAWRHGPSEYVNAPNRSTATCPDGWNKVDQATEWTS